MSRVDGHGLPADVSRVLDDARQLRRRLLRLAEALAVSSAQVAEHLEEAAPARGPQQENLRLIAKQMATTADACRDFATRLRRGDDG